ncbi:hypothetical protein Nepgr_003588 [Nepenthes gracilis]|uniref:Uncharacterized protein n=1 Tax=Nepenthes gracilis TaxID=150966 RepID=A0AAD3RZS3_NEPGR|nr:hypothetical protein Nepgr_003588 [Nepenthes gracilis]
MLNNQGPRGQVYKETGCSGWGGLVPHGAPGVLGKDEAILTCSEVPRGPKSPAGGDATHRSADQQSRAFRSRH